jgi:hypothetical protein
MARLGHSSVRAALIYQHATRDRDQAIAQALGTFVRDLQNAAQKQADEPEDAEGKHKNARVARVWHAAARNPESQPHSNTETGR